jgi:CubicO group peptidase (beta-lactamase class C family)
MTRHRVSRLFFLTFSLVMLAACSGPELPREAADGADTPSRVAAEHAAGPTAELDDPFPAASPGDVGLSKAAVAELARIVRHYVDEGRILGAELLVIKNRRTVLHEACGWKDREEDLPMTIGTIFNIRSMTKPLTGAAAQTLIDEGRLALDDLVSNFLEGFASGAVSEITIEQLLTHRAGLPLSILAEAGEYPDLLTMANAIGHNGTEFTPGDQFYYSDGGTDVLGAVIEQVTGERLDDFVAAKLLEPLGMTDSFYYTTASAADPRHERIAPIYMAQSSGFTKLWTAEEPLYPFAWGSQTLYSTPKEYARFLAMWLDAGVWEDRAILTPEAVQRSLTPASRMTVMGGGMESPTGFLDIEVHYGQMAVLYVDATGETIVIGHSGSDGTVAWAWPDQDLMILVFTQSRGSSFWQPLESAIDRLFFHPEIAQLNAEGEEAYERLLGTYVDVAVDRPTEATEIAVFNGELALVIPQGLIFTLEPIDAPLLWRFDLLPSQHVTFVEEDDGTVGACRLSGPVASEDLIRGEPLPRIELAFEDVSRLLGTYLDEEGGREIDVVFDAGKLVLIIPENPLPLELLPPDEDGWWRFHLNPAVAIRFDLDETGSVVSFTARSPEGEAVRPRVDVTPDPHRDDAGAASHSP